MPLASTPAAQEEHHVDPDQLRRATLASSVGVALEYYDFYIYGLAAALIFGPLFFGPLGDAGATIAAFGTYAVGFAARPIGGLVFGHLGDKVGRKSILIITIALMGGSSFLIGCLPTYAAAGMVGPVLLVVLRILQGLGAGAEQAGATVLISEFAPPRRRGFFASLPFVGIQLGTVLGAGTFALIALAPRGSLRLVVAPSLPAGRNPGPGRGLDSLEAGLRRSRSSSARAASRSRWGSGKRCGPRARTSSSASGCAWPRTGTRRSTPPCCCRSSGAWRSTRARTPVRWGVIAAVVSAIMVVVFGFLSDKYGRVRVYRFGALFQAIIALPAFYLLTLGQTWLVFVVMSAGIGIGVQAMLGPQCALLPELFGNTHRYTGVAMSREISAVLAGGIALAGCIVAGCDRPCLVGRGRLLALPHHLRDHVRDA